MPTSHDLFARAQRFIPGGVDSPVRAYKSVGIEPRFVDHAEGAHVHDVDGNTYLDFVQSWGPMILGHGHPEVLEAVRTQLERGTTYGAPTELETEAAELVCAAFPSIEMVRFVSSGTEAVMSAIRLARGFTGRDKIIKFDGNYHGHSDAMLVAAGSGLLTLGIPSTPGVTEGTAGDTIVVPYNDLGAVEAVFAGNPDQIAALIVEPVAGNMGCVPPAEGFLAGLRALCDSHGALLIFDEVITGFRIAYGGAQERYGVTPDLTTLGKIIGGGFPVGAFGGRREIMDRLAPTGPVYQAGTLSGNPVAMAAGIATMKVLGRDGVYADLEEKGKLLAAGLKRAADEAGIPASGTQVGAMGTLFFTSGPVTDWKSAALSDTERYANYFRKMLERGIWLAPSQFECCFTSCALTHEDIENTVLAAEEVMGELAVESFRAPGGG
ncbi:MAG: glutamate-1-semialdehyde 2,1-aminomutase [Actinomycetia bacterium]|nr:glutamate-1-semialdehyde 2,1-aminomutase [Actinomycetes bacterium]